MRLPCARRTGFDPCDQGPIVRRGRLQSQAATVGGSARRLEEQQAPPPDRAERVAAPPTRGSRSGSLPPGRSRRARGGSRSGRPPCHDTHPSCIRTATGSAPRPARNPRLVPARRGPSPGSTPLRPPASPGPSPLPAPTVAMRRAHRRRPSPAGSARQATFDVRSTSPPRGPTPRAINWRLESPGESVIEAGLTRNLDGVLAMGLGGEIACARVMSAPGAGSRPEVDAAPGVDSPPQPSPPSEIKGHAIHPESRLATIHSPCGDRLDTGWPS